MRIQKDSKHKNDLVYVLFQSNKKQKNTKEQKKEGKKE